MANNSTLPNTATLDHPEITWSQLLVGTILYVITLVTVLGNVLVLLAVKVNPRLQTTFNLYIVNLAVTDVAVAVTAMSFHATYTVLGYWPFGEVLCALWIFFDYGMTFVSVFTLILISGDRFWSVTWSVHYRQHHTKKKCIIAISLAWVFMLVLWLPPWLVDRVRYSEPGVCFWDPSLNVEFVYIVASLGHHGPYCVMLFCYIHVFVFMHKRVKVSDTLVVRGAWATQSSSSTAGPQEVSFTATSGISTTPPKQKSSTAKQTQTQEVSFTSTSGSATTSPKHKNPAAKPTQVDPVSTCANSQVPGNRLKPPQRNSTIKQTSNGHHVVADSRQKRERKVFITLTYIIVAYGILWLPFHVVFDISILDPGLVPEPVLNLAFWMAYVNSTINPLLYNFSSEEFRKTFKRLLRCKC